MPAALAQSSEAGPYQRSLGHPLRLPHPTQNLRLPLPAPPAFSLAETLPRSQLAVATSPARKAPSSLLSDYAHSLATYHSPRTSVGWDSRAASPLHLVPGEASLAHPRIFSNPGSALLSPVPSQTASPASFVDMDPRYPLSRRADDPIEDLEWVYVFTDILRHARDGGHTARLASQVLFDNIQQISSYQPSWEEVSLPGGRNLRSIQEAYRVFGRTGPGVPPPQPPKRPLQMDSQTPLGRPIAPKPPLAGPTGAIRSLPAGSPTIVSPLTTSSSAVPPEPRRKRGRPSKRETEDRKLRQSEARASVDLTGLHLGSIMPSSRTFGTSQYGQVLEVPASPAASLPAVASTAAATPRATSQDPSSNGSGGSGGKKKRGRPPKNPSQQTILPPLFNPSGSSRDRPDQESSRAGASQSLHSEAMSSTKTAEAEESKQQKWKDTILNE